MGAVLICRLHVEGNCEGHPFILGRIDFKGVQIVSGKDYYIAKAVERGAYPPIVKPKRKVAKKQD